MMTKGVVRPQDIFQIFVNRITEIDRLTERVLSIEPGRIAAIVGHPDTGLSSAVNQLTNRLPKSSNVILVDLNDHQPDAILLQTLRAVFRMGPQFSKKILLPLARPEKRDLLGKVLNDGLKRIPKVGEILGNSSDVIAELMDYGHRELVYNTELTRLFTQLQSAGSTFLIVDHFQHAQHHHVMQLTNILAATPTIRVLAAQNVNGGNLSAQITSNSIAPYLDFVDNFPQPNEHLAQTILQHLSVKAGIQMCQSTLPDITQGLREFLNHIYTRLKKNGSDEHDLTQMEEQILSLLGTAQTGLTSTVIFNCLSDAHMLIPDTETLKNSVQKLISLGLLNDSMPSNAYSSLHLTGPGVRSANRLLSNLRDQILFSEILYRGLSRLVRENRIAEAQYAPTLYRLSAVTAKAEQSLWQISTIKSCVQAADFFEASALLQQAEVGIDAQSDKDKRVLLAACIAAKEYQRALSICKSMAEPSIQMRGFEAIMHYRCNDFAQAKGQFEKLLEETLPSNMRCIISTYYEALLINLNLSLPIVINKGAEFDDLTACHSFGYLLYILAATRPAQEAIEMCQRSLAHFKTHNDIFGEGGARANIGVHYMRAKNYESALMHSVDAHEILKLFGIQHIHLVANNIASIKLAQGDLGAAETWNRKSLSLSQTTTIRTRALSNSAALSFLQGHPDDALAAILQAKSIADDQPIPKVKSNINKTLGLFSTLLPTSKELQLYATATLPKGSDPIQYFRANYVLPNNQYWFPNPMELFEGEALSVETYV